MLAQNIIDSVFALPVADQLELLDRLRERLRHGGFPLTDEQKHLLDYRIAEFDADPSQGRPWEEVEAEILAKLAAR